MKKASLKKKKGKRKPALKRKTERTSGVVRRFILKQDYPIFLRGTTKKHYYNARRRGFLPGGKYRNAPAFILTPGSTFNERSFVKRLQASIYSSVDYALNHSMHQFKKGRHNWVFLGKKIPDKDLPVLFLFGSKTYFRRKDAFGIERQYRQMYEQVELRGTKRPTFREAEPGVGTRHQRIEFEDEVAKFTVTRTEFGQAHKRVVKALKKQGFKFFKKHYSDEMGEAYQDMMRDELCKIIISKLVKRVQEGKL